MSIKEIAEKTGVSYSTVSRILNNPNYHSNDPTLTKRVWDAVAETNYIPNTSARNLRKEEGKEKRQENTLRIGVLMTRTDGRGADPFFEDLLHIVRQEICDAGCALVHIWNQEIFSNDVLCKHENMEHRIRLLYDETQGECDGLIIIGKCNHDAVKILQKVFENVVIVSRNTVNYLIDEVLCDGERIAHLAVEHLIGLGYREIGYIGSCHGEKRYQGYVETLEQHGLKVLAENVADVLHGKKGGYDAMQHFIENGHCPSAIYCANDITAIGVLACLSEHKEEKLCPAIISGDDIEQAQFCSPMLTTIRLPKEEMGKTSCKLLLDRIRGGHQSVVKIEFEGKLIVRESCPAPQEAGVQV